MVSKVRKYDRSSRLVSTAIVTLIGLVFVLPLIWMLSASLQINGDIFKYPFTWLPHAPRWVNYADIWNSGEVPLLQMYRNSLFIVIFTNIGVLFVSLLAAYAFARIEFKGKGIVFGLFIGVMMIPSQVTVVPRFLLFKELNIYNTLWAVILPTVGWPFGVFLMKQFSENIPNELLEASRIDGAGETRTFLEIVLPLIAPGIGALAIFTFISTWNDYFLQLIMLNDTQVLTISLGIAKLQSELSTDFGLIMAGAALGSVPIIIIFLIFQKFFTRGITMGAVKG